MMLDCNNVYKVKDSVDIFLVDGKILSAYFMNSRTRKTFRVNDVMIEIIESIDGEKTVEELLDVIRLKYNISYEQLENIILDLLKSKIITLSMAKNDILESEIQDRYDRQINYWSEFLDSEEDGLIAQKKIMDCKIIIFGCGAIGGNIALELVMAGVNNITLFDYDIVQHSDISRHMWFEYDSINKLKVEVLKDNLMLINPDAKITVIKKYLEVYDDLEELVSKYDFVVNTLDEPYIGYTSAKISRVCIKYNIPHYIAGGFDAHLASTGELVVPYKTPCVECYAKHFKVALKDWKPCNHPVITRYDEIGGLASMSLFSSSFASLAILKHIVGINVDSVENLYHTRGELLFETFSLDFLNVEKDNDCCVCGE